MVYYGKFIYISLEYTNIFINLYRFQQDKNYFKVLCTNKYILKSNKTMVIFRKCRKYSFWILIVLNASWINCSIDTFIINNYLCTFNFPHFIIYMFGLCIYWKFRNITWEFTFVVNLRVMLTFLLLQFKFV